MGIMGVAIVLQIAIDQIDIATNIDYYILLHFPFGLFVFALGSYLTLAVSFIHAREILFRIRSSFYKDTIHQPQGQHASHIDIPRSLRYFLTASKHILPIALVLLVLGIATPGWTSYKTGEKRVFQGGIWYKVVNGVCCKLNLEEDVIHAKVFSLIATVLTLLSVIVAKVTTARKQKHTHTTYILVSFCLTLASASFSAWIAGFAINLQVMKNDEHVFPYSLFLFSFGTVLNGLMAIYQAVILFRIWNSVTTLRDDDIAPFLDNNTFELPDIHENIPETDEPPPYIIHIMNYFPSPDTELVQGCRS
ncbi:uncharacterized protein LOC127848995 [Dreissena polymorpha]|uniref:uncharacterized protein LOC127848995 n=1 Tax=Dreissena polymorpha TaxID=45954 RepID=UPI002263C8DD|nr:uncharacterized protein LOC127848995 [Dreissena polymorpha]